MKKRNQVGALEIFAWLWLSALFILSLTTKGIFNGLSLHSSLINLTYEPPILYSLLISFTGCLWVAIHFLKKDYELQHRDIYTLAGVALGIVYVVSSMNSESDYMMKHSIWFGFMIAVLFIAGTFVAGYRRLVEYFPRLYILFGYLVVGYGFLNLFGNVYLNDALSMNEGVRISSIFQYPNAYAVLLLTLWIVLLTKVIEVQTKWALLSHGFMLVPVILSFLLTLSRGAVFILPIIAIATLLLFRFREQLKLILYSVVPLILALLVYSPLQNAGEETFQRIQSAKAAAVVYETISFFSNQSLPHWLLLIAASGVSAAAIYFSERWLGPKIDKLAEKWNSSNIGVFIMPAITLVLTLIGALVVAIPAINKLLPEVIRARVGNISWETHSVYERLTMYKDALKIWAENPIFGSGRGAWESYYEQYQSYAYLSAQPHSYLFQLLVETGLVGLIVFLGVVVTTFVHYIRKRRQLAEFSTASVFYYIVPSTILLHSLIDFEMSYLFYTFIVFFCLGVLAGMHNGKLKIQITKRGLNKVKWTAAASLSVVGVIVFVFVVRQMYALEKFNKAQAALESQRAFATVQAELTAALDVSPNHPVALYQATVLNLQVFDQTEDPAYLEKASSYAERLNQHERRYREIVDLNYYIALRNNDSERASEILLEKINDYPFDTALYELTAKELLRQYEAQQSATDSGKLVELAQQIEQLYLRMEKQEQIIRELPETIELLRPFQVTNVVRSAYEKVKPR
ncbi:O-antigen ligase family protein [Cohnella sp. LGH]|uniref:O-antigen ligase family protein n=1 Tax=Cohnella sp. LGH TaxID=1619153 RepID=UPI001ADA7851|nr:O-antigen ligase family protein [Cohnella sp. LGH]QTH42339.1 O-antigen ligase family protein [Cohnella sp. LGH]